MNDKIAKALVSAQAEMPAIEMNATNPFLKNKYADLGAIIKTVRPILAKHGLAFSQLAVGSGGEVGIKTMLIHESGEFIVDTITLPMTEERGKSSAQAAGSIITYLRRYSLSAILGIYADEDTDGTPVQQHTQKKQAPKKAQVKSTSNIFDTVTNKEGVLYNTLELEDLVNTVNGINKYLKDNQGLEQDRRDEYELKRDAAEHFIKIKRENA